MFNDYILKEAEEYSTMENCPLIYILIIPRLIKLGEKECKKDKMLKKTIDATEKALKELPKETLKDLEKDFNPYTIMEMYKINNNSKTVFDTYFLQIKEYIELKCKKFTEVLKYDKILTELYNSSEYEVFKNNI